MLVCQLRGAGLGLLEGVALILPEQERAVLRTNLPHPKQITAVGRGADLEAVRAALGGVGLEFAAHGLVPAERGFVGVHSLKGLSGRTWGGSLNSRAAIPR